MIFLNMGSEQPQIFIIFVLVCFLNAHFLLAADSSNKNAVQNSNDAVVAAGLDGLYREEYNGDGKETQIEKVSGEDENDEKRDLVLEKFRILLGLKNLPRSSSSHVIRNGFLSPSPAPSIEKANVPAPAPVPVAYPHLHSHFPRPRSILPPLHHEAVRGGDKTKSGKIVIAAAVSSGVVTVISALGLFLFCWKFKKGRRRSAKTMSVSGYTGCCFGGTSKNVSLPNHTNKVSFELGPEHFDLNSLEPPVSELDASPVKHTYETVNISWKPKETNTTLEVESESGNDSRKSHSNNVSCSSVEDIHSVHEIREAVEYVTDNRNCSMETETVPNESLLSSDDESFHSFCDSHSSNVRGSNASEGDLSDPSEVFSPPRYPKRASTPGDSSKTPVVSSSIKLPMTPDLNRPIRPNLEASPLNTPCNLKETSSTSQCSSNSSHHFPPPPPPPPPPYLHFSSSQSSSSLVINKSTTPCLTTPSKVPFHRNSDSSSGSDQTLPDDYAASNHQKPQLPIGSPTGPPGSGKNIPPPPCPPLLPPSFAKGNGSPLQPPPPPPGLFPQCTPVGKDGAPLPKLKPLHWDKVRATPDRSMVWDKLKSSSFEFDEEMIESLFGYKLQNVIKNGEGKSKSPSPSKHVLEPKRLQNITILLKALNATAEQVCTALVQGNGLCLQQLEALAKIVPTKEEETLLLHYQGNTDELGSAEKFVKTILTIPFAFLRIEAMLYRDTFEDEVVHLQKSFAMLEEACKELRSSQLFLKLLEAVLKTGNRMNIGTIRGGARAFKLDALLKLADVKGTDGKTTLLHFVVQEMIRSEGIRESDIIIKKNNMKIMSKIVEQEEDHRRTGLDHVSGLSAELCNVKKTATIDLDVLASSVSNLSDGMVKLRHLVYEALSKDDQKVAFSQSMRSFLDYAENNIKELKKDEDRVLLHVREITEYFHGDVSKDEANPLRIFVIVRDFLGMLDQVCKELRSSKTPKSPNPVAPFR